MTLSYFASKNATLCLRSDISSLIGRGFKLSGTYLLEPSEEDTADEDLWLLDFLGMLVFSSVKSLEY